jgi:hypothetical protein
VDGPAVGAQALAEAGDRREGGEVEVLERQPRGGVVGADAGDGGLALGAVADGQDDLRAGGGQGGGDAGTHPVAGAGDDRSAAGQVGDVDSVRRARHGVSSGGWRRDGGRAPRA